MRRAACALLLLPVACLACSGGEDAVDFDDGRAGAGDTAARLPYPEAPYGTLVGSIVEDFRFLGWPHPKQAAFDTGALEPLSLAEFYDPSGAKGLRWIFLTTAAEWCSACKAEWADIRSKGVSQYEKEGVVFMGTLFEDRDSNPAGPKNLAAWAKAYDVDFPFVLDPALKLGPFFDVEATPMSMIIDARTMTILSIETGWVSGEGEGTLWATLDQLLGR